MVGEESGKRKLEDVKMRECEEERQEERKL